MYDVPVNKSRNKCQPTTYISTSLILNIAKVVDYFSLVNDLFQIEWRARHETMRQQRQQAVSIWLKANIFTTNLAKKIVPFE